jgi:hypothetical protein
MEVQVRSEETGTRNYPTFQEALDQAEIDISIWKISFDIETGERVRLTRNGNGFFEYHSVFDNTTISVYRRTGERE